MINKIINFHRKLKQHVNFRKFWPKLNLQILSYGWDHLSEWASLLHGRCHESKSFFRSQVSRRESESLQWVLEAKSFFGRIKPESLLWWVKPQSFLRIVKPKSFCRLDISFEFTFRLWSGLGLVAPEILVRVHSFHLGCELLTCRILLGRNQTGNNERRQQSKIDAFHFRF